MLLRETPFGLHKYSQLAARVLSFVIHCSNICAYISTSFQICSKQRNNKSPGCLENYTCCIISGNGDEKGNWGTMRNDVSSSQICTSCPQIYIKCALLRQVRRFFIWQIETWITYFLCSVHPFPPSLFPNSLER